MHENCLTDFTTFVEESEISGQTVRNQMVRFPCGAEAKVAGLPPDFFIPREWLEGGLYYTHAEAVRGMTVNL